MGMFTSIIHPKNGRELQIKTGDDLCEFYKVGDKVPFHVVKNIYGAGGIFDGIYSSYSDKGEDDWVIIKGHTVVAVRSRRYKLETLIKQYAIRKPNKKLWNKTALKEYEKRNKKIQKESDSFLKSIKKLPFEQQMSALLARPLIRRLNYDSVIKKAFSVEAM